MTKLKLPLYGKILAWFALNLALLGVLFLFFLRAQFGLGLDWMLSGQPGERIGAIGDAVTEQFAGMPESEWEARLRALDAAHGVRFALFNRTAEQIHGVPLAAPPEVKSRLRDRPPPSGRAQRPPPAERAPPRPPPKRPLDAPPKPRFMMRAGDPARYWAGIHLDLATLDGSPLSLVMVSDSISGGGLFFDLWPWLALALAALLLSALLWLPFVRGIANFIRVLNEAAGSIAQGKFDVRVNQVRNDELGELSASVNAMAAQLGHSMREQKRITADVAHELCSPIARMQMALGVIEQRATPEQDAYLRKLDGELQHMAKLVEEVLAFSEAETLPDTEPHEEVDLRPLIDDVLAREAPETSVRCEIDDVKVATLRRALDRAVGNVVRNAVRYAADIEVIAKAADNGAVIIEIRDRGPGVPAETVPRLFEPFYRPEAARRRSTGGSGLGLAIAKRCTEACGGTITARNRDGGGLAVTLVIPRQSLALQKHLA